MMHFFKWPIAIFICFFSTISWAVELDTVVVTAKLGEARHLISPSLGATTYTIGTKQLSSIPLGENTTFDQVLLRTPGVAQDSDGLVRIRGDHGNVQYRVNDILIPEGISGFGQEIDTRMIETTTLITGALPAQYGLRTAAVVDIDTRSGSINKGGTLFMGGGDANTLRSGITYGGNSGNLSYFVSGGYLQSSLGIQNPTAGNTAIHDDTQQYKLFGYANYLLDDSSAINVIVGGSRSDFQLPNTAGLPGRADADGNPDPVPGIDTFDSAKLNDNQRELNHYQIVSYQKNAGDLNYQVAALNRYSDVAYTPDVTGQLYFNGVASKVHRWVNANGIQADSSYVIASDHTLRSGLLLGIDQTHTDSTTTVFETDGDGHAVGTAFDVIDNVQKTSTTTSFYLQDEWRLTPAWTVNWGGRFDAVNAYVNESQLSPRINATYKLNPATTVHAGYARYFTPAPVLLVQDTTISKFAGTTNEPEVKQNNPVRAERADYYDLGVTHQLNAEIQLGIDGYYKNAQNLLDEGLFGQALIPAPINYESGRIWGIEGSINYSKDGWNAYANLAISRAVGTKLISGQFLVEQAELDYINSHDVYLDHDQRITGSFGASYSWQKTKIYLDVLYGSGLRRGFASTDQMPAYYPINIGLQQGIHVDRLGELVSRVDILNVFDQVYALRDGTGIGVNSARYGLGRSLQLNFSLKF